MTNQDINKWLRLEEKQNFYKRKALENAFTVNTLQSPKKITNNDSAECCLIIPFPLIKSTL
jgi:hypothetical protein